MDVSVGSEIEERCHRDNCESLEDTNAAEKQGHAYLDQRNIRNSMRGRKNSRKEVGKRRQGDEQYGEEFGEGTGRLGINRSQGTASNPRGN